MYLCNTRKLIEYFFHIFLGSSQISFDHYRNGCIIRDTQRNCYGETTMSKTIQTFAFDAGGKYDKHGQTIGVAWVTLHTREHVACYFYDLSRGIDDRCLFHHEQGCYTENKMAEGLQRAVKHVELNGGHVSSREVVNKCEDIDRDLIKQMREKAREAAIAFRNPPTEPTTPPTDEKETKQMTHNVEYINKALRQAAHSDAKHAENLVMEHYLPMFEIIQAETDGAWPSKSLTKTLISRSQVLTDMFVFLTPEQISEFARDCKYVQANFDAVVDEALANGWRKLSAIRKAIQKAQKAEETDETKETDETTEAEALPLENTDFISEVASLLAQAQEAGFDPHGIAQAALAEIADPDPLEIPAAFRR